jgi:hypothetical protein
MESFSRSSRTFLISSNAGKPLWSSRGDDTAQARLSSVVQALTARSSDALGGGETLSSMSIGGGVFIVFLSRGPLILMAASRTGESEAALRAQLRALHAQLLFSLTNKIHKRLVERPGADVRPLLAGCDLPFRTLLRASSRSPALWLDAFPVLSLPSGMRSQTLSALSTTGTGNDDGIVFVVLSAGYSVVAWTQSSSSYQFQPQDFFLLSSFLCSSASKCREGADAWTPICLPGLSEGAFVSAYVACIGLGIPGQKFSSYTSTSSSNGFLPEISSPTPTSILNGGSIIKSGGEDASLPVNSFSEELINSIPLKSVNDADNNVDGNHSQLSMISPLPILNGNGTSLQATTLPSAAFSPLGRLSFASPLALALAAAPLAPPYSADRSKRRFQRDQNNDTTENETEVLLNLENAENTPSDLLDSAKMQMELSSSVLNKEMDENERDSNDLVVVDANHDDQDNERDENVMYIGNKVLKEKEENEELHEGEDEDEEDEQEAQEVLTDLPKRILGGATPRVTRLARWAALSVASTSDTRTNTISNSIIKEGEGFTTHESEKYQQSSSRPYVPLPVPPSPWTPPPPYHPDRDGSATPLFLSIISTGSSSEHLEALAAKRASIGKALLQKGLLSSILRSMECVEMETQSGGGTAPFTTSDAPASAYGVAGLVHFLYLWKPSRQYSMSVWPQEMLSTSPGPLAFTAGHRKRKALLRAYQRIHERLTIISAPNVRHASSSFLGGSFDERSRFSSETSSASLIAHVAGVNTSQCILLCSFDAAVDSTKVPILAEKLLKALRRDHDRLFF